MNRYSQTSALISSILPAVGDVGLDQQVVDLGRDGVGVLGHDRREEVRVADRLEDRLARPVATGQDEPEGVTPGLGADPMRVRRSRR